MPYIIERHKLNLAGTQQSASHRASTASTTTNIRPPSKKNLVIDGPKPPAVPPPSTKPLVSRVSRVGLNSASSVPVVSKSLTSSTTSTATGRQSTALQPIQSNQRPNFRPSHPLKPAVNPSTEVDNSIVAVLALIPFAPQPIVNFGQVCLGETQHKRVALRNLQDTQQELSVKIFPKPEKQIDIDALEFVVPAKTELYVTLSWSPKVVGSIRETITFQDSNKLPRRIVIVGAAVRSKPEPANRAKALPKFVPSTPSRLAIKSRFDQSSKELPRKLAPNGPTQRLLIYASRRRQSGQLVKKIQSKFNDEKAVIIQSYWRMILAQRQLRKLKEKHVIATRVQSLWRMILAKRQFSQIKRQHESIVLIQSQARGWLCRRRYNATKKAIILLQSHIRRLIAIRQLEALKLKHEAAVKIQSYFRMITAKRELAYLRRKHEAAVMIQSQWKAHAGRRNFLELKCATISVQSKFRQILARRQMVALIERRDAIVKLQSFFRMLLARRELQELKLRSKAALTIQSKWRAHVVQQQYKKTKDAVLAVQKAWRQVLARRQLQLLNARKNSVICIQSYMRMILARRQLTSLKRSSQASILIQAHWRGLLERRRFKSIRWATVVMQSQWRGRSARKELTRLKSLNVATLFIQSQCRGYLMRAKLKKSIEAILRIQTRQQKLARPGQQQLILA